MSGFCEFRVVIKHMGHGAADAIQGSAVGSASARVFIWHNEQPVADDYLKTK